MGELSRLYSTYNGFTLGAFLASIRFPFVQRRYGAFRRRIGEFFKELDIDVVLPRTQTAFARRADDLLGYAIAAARPRSAILADFIGVGAMAVLQGASAHLVTDDQRRVLRDRWLPTLEKHDVRAAAYDEWLAALPRKKETVYAEDILSPASLLLARAIESLDADRETCFVAMPFRQPFLGYFTTFYGPALERAGMRAIRAWGGLSSEEYYLFLMTLISRSGAVLADLTTLNLNVINEVGIAHGIPRVVFLIGRKPLAHAPSNIAHLPIHQYSDSEADWLPRATEKCAAYIEWMREDFDARWAQE